MSDFDRELFEVITDVDGASILELRELVELRGVALVSRVIADGFAAVFQASDDDLFRPFPADQLRKWQYLSTEEALQVVQLDQIPNDFRVAQARGAIDLQREPTLIFRYAADEPEAVAEVRSRHGRE
jgi:hypothetical protein